MTESHPEEKIIVIPAKNESPQEQAKKRNLRVAAYCRVSTGDEEQLTSYENQTKKAVCPPKKMNSLAAMKTRKPSTQKRS